MRTEQGLRDNISIGITYLHAWLSGNGAAAIRNLMEDAATAEISRSQVWQWVWNGATLDTGEVITRDAVEQLVEQEYAGLVRDADPADLPLWETARRLFVESALGAEFVDFLTLPAYQAVLALERA